MIDLASTGIRKSDRLANKPKQKYGLFDKFALEVIGACEVYKNPHIFPTRKTNTSRKLIDTLMEP